MPAHLKNDTRVDSVRQKDVKSTRSLSCGIGVRVQVGAAKHNKGEKMEISGEGPTEGKALKAEPIGFPAGSATKQVKERANTVEQEERLLTWKRARGTAASSMSQTVISVPEQFENAATKHFQNVGGRRKKRDQEILPDEQAFIAFLHDPCTLDKGWSLLGCEENPYGK